MKSTIVNRITNDNQYPVVQTKEGQVSERNFVANLIREYCVPKNGGYSLHVSDLEPIDQKLLLSYCVAADTYEWSCQNPIRLQQVINEYADDMQSCINEIIDEVYNEDMEEMGAMLCHHKDNNEPFWKIT